MDKKTFRKYNLGSPRRASRRKKHSGFEKYKIGPPRRPSSEMELTEVFPSIITFSTPKASPRLYREEMKHTPRTAAWEKWEKKGELGYIDDYEEDEDDKLAKKKRAKLGIRSPKTYTTFEDVQTPYMTQAYKKKPLTDAIEEVDVEAWKRKKDDPPTRNPGKSLIGRMGRIGGIGGIRGRRRYSRRLSRCRGRGRSRR
jgi:hypothetical protein